MKAVISGSDLIEKVLLIKHEDTPQPFELLVRAVLEAGNTFKDDMMQPYICIRRADITGDRTEIDIGPQMKDIRA